MNVAGVCLETADVGAGGLLSMQKQDKGNILGMGGHNLEGYLSVLRRMGLFRELPVLSEHLCGENLMKPFKISGENPAIFG